MNATQTWTVGKLLEWTTDYLRKQGSASPRLDAEVLLAHARDCQRIQLYTAFDEEPPEPIRTAFREMVRRRAEGTPVAYLVGYKEFYSHPFEVNPDVLIPRPETEHLVLEALDRAKELHSSRGADVPSLMIADVGTGSGIVAITVAKHYQACSLVAIDLSPAALQVARRNADRHQVSERIEFNEGDLLTACDPEQKFDLIVSNPPYVSEHDYGELEKSVRDFEPRSALIAGPDGSEVIVRLLDQAHARLADDGFLIFELSPMLAARSETFVGPGWDCLAISQDLAGHARIVTLRKK